MPKRPATPRKRKLPAGVTGMAEHVEKKRVKAVSKAAREFRKLPPAEQVEQLKAVLPIRTRWLVPPKE